MAAAMALVYTSSFHQDSATTAVLAFSPSHLTFTPPSTRSTRRGLVGGTHSRSNVPGSPSITPSGSSTLLFSTPPSSSSEKRKLSRPERKALEREKKERQGVKGYQNDDNNSHYNKRSNRKHNFNARQKELSSKGSAAEGPYDLHSNRISELNSDSTADDVVKAIKRAQNLHDAHDIRNIETFLIEKVDESFAYGYRGSLLARLAVAALHMSNHELARKAIEVRRTEHRSSMLPMESSAIIRGMLRVHNTTDAINLLNDELSLPLAGTPLDTPANQDRIKHRALSLCSVASRHFFEGEPCLAVKACKMLVDLGPSVRQSRLTAASLEMPWTRLIQGAAQCDSGIRSGSVVPCQPDVDLPCNLVYSVLNAMATFPSDNNDQTYEALSNSLVRRTVFVTGAVTVDGCPEADRGEVVFIGRSNVGKSSLVNMVTNRKSLAYTSKRPGKTQQFNYFAVNDKSDREKEIRFGDEVTGEKDADSFYIVDVPGFGFAQVPDKQRLDWSSFLSKYLDTRKTLRVVFHLVDGRHGPIDEDVNVMRNMADTLGKRVKYVVVLTKADKNVKGASKTNQGSVSKQVLSKLREAMNKNGVGKAPILLTSAETKLGRDDIWRYMRLAAEV